ncbi:hypothetical protein MAR_023368 [Mya arenaria]|uniref:Mitochondria-eating protein C-terminal domain-containing protein n=1 Tax=Mya arenaria TaxID=6604 RepID=A0ABY7DRM5_MYAAR|nr:hypothetical protein MAR_023368 [Mya arenaria]
MTSNDKDLRIEARNFCDSLANVFMMKRRDPQTQRLLEKSKGLLEALLKEQRIKADRPVVPPKPRGGTGGGGMGQLWIKLDELKRENEDMRRKMLSKKSEEKQSPGKSQSPGEVIISELHKCKSENETLRSQLEKSQTEVKELERVNLTLQDEFKRTKIAQEVSQDTLEKIRKERSTLESSLVTVKSENDTLKMRLTHSVKPIKRPDPRLVENIQERCRPSTVAHAYTHLESQEWVDAKEALEDAGYDDEVAVTRVLAELLMLDSGYLTCARDSGTLPEELLGAVKENLRHHTEHVDVQPIVQKCKERIAADPKWNQFEGLLSHKSIERYVAQCARVTWQMVAQHVPMWLCTDDTVFDEETHKLWWSCEKSEDASIKLTTKL